jgi:hypothetical protein
MLAPTNKLAAIVQEYYMQPAGAQRCRMRAKGRKTAGLFQTVGMGGGRDPARRQENMTRKPPRASILRA